MSTLVVLQEDRNNSVTIGVADERIGLVLGRNGRSVMEISQVSKEVAIFSLPVYVLRGRLL